MTDGECTWADEILELRNYKLVLTKRLCNIKRIPGNKETERKQASCFNDKDRNNTELNV